ncbi:MAG TPA: hypothetical protein VK717_07440 [Opitutaceae bacterium]|jgi:hypothetical protein|nr:hypothetical protein [Opitutaceae bacterium]
MNQLLEPETPPAKRGRIPRFLRDDDTQSAVVGILLTLILWPLLIWTFSWAIGHLHGASNVKLALTPRTNQFNIELAPQELRQPKPPPPNRFVEANPDAPEHIPDKTQNFAAHNQQAAQPKPSPKTGNDHPETTGKKDIDSTQIVDGHLADKQPVPTPPEPATPPNTTPKAAPIREQNPLTGHEKDEGEDKNAFGTNLGQVAENVQNVPNKVEGVKEAPLIEGANSTTPQIDPKHPMPRRTLSQQNVRPAIFADNPTGTSNIGLASWDARWSNYGQYLQQLIDTVQAQWDKLLTNAGSLPASGTHVVVTFRLKSDGTVSEILKVDGDAGKLGETYCASAITIPGTAPGYGKWTDDMVAILGDQQDLTFAFYYY